MQQEIKKLESQNSYFYTLLNKDLLKEIAIEVQFNDQSKLFKIPTHLTCVRAYQLGLEEFELKADEVDMYDLSFSRVKLTSQLPLYPTKFILSHSITIFLQREKEPLPRQHMFALCTPFKVI